MDNVVPAYGMQLNAEQLKFVGLTSDTFLSSGLGHGIDDNCIKKMIAFIQDCFKD